MHIGRRYIGAAGLLLGIGASMFFPHLRGKVKAMLPDGGPPIVRYHVAAAHADQRARFWAADHRAPLIVDLHQWSGTEKGFNGNDERFDLAVKRAGWNFVRPNLEGPNNHPQACCSKDVLAEIQGAIDYSEAHGRVDGDAIYIVGESGGGYTALCAYMSGTIPARAYFSWAGITDLAQWRQEHPGDRYGRDVEACTGSTGGKLNRGECARRSPMTMGSAKSETPLWLFAGVHDGSTGSFRTSGSVPFTHSINLFNRLAMAGNHPASRVNSDLTLQLINDRTGPDSPSGLRVGGRSVHLYRTAGQAHLVIFEGSMRC